MHEHSRSAVNVWTDDALDGFIAALDSRIQTLLVEVEQTEVWRVVTAPSTDPHFVRAVMREVYLEIYSYQPYVIEATIAIIGRMPKADASMIQKMLIHQAQEADHGEMALRDYVALGGDEHYARTRRISPESFAVASLWWGLWRMEDPFAYLGALYPFEGLTPIVSQRVRDRILGSGFPTNALEYLTFHAEEDIKHANLVKKLLRHAVATYPTAAESILAGLEYFLAVYPIPVWTAAHRRACADLARGHQGASSASTRMRSA
jgi:pyrroloquinoline quinone (PQQ) biosynthesis protein C